MKRLKRKRKENLKKQLTNLFKKYILTTKQRSEIKMGKTFKDAKKSGHIIKTITKNVTPGKNNLK